MSIVKEYKDASWGIYDDTADLDRAIAISDAYYGDRSSVVQLCKKVGMPVMIQNPLLSLNRNIVFNNFIIDSENIYAVTLFANLMLKINLATKKINFVKSFDIETSYQMFYDGMIVDSVIWFVPFFSDKIAVYNILDDTINYIALPNEINNYTDYAKFGVSFVYDKKIYMFGYMIPYILIIDCGTRFIQLINLTDRDNSILEKVYFRDAYVIIDDKAYLPMQQSEKILMIDLITLDFKFIDIIYNNHSTLKGYTCIDFYGDVFSLYNWLGEKVLLDKSFNFIKIENAEEVSDINRLNPYQLVINNNNSFIKIPYYRTELVYENNNISETKILEKNIYEYNNGIPMFSFVKEYEDSIFLQSCTSGNIYKVSKSRNMLVIENLVLYDHMDFELKLKRKMIEAQSIDLEQFIKNIE